MSFDEQGERVGSAYNIRNYRPDGDLVSIAKWASGEPITHQSHLNRTAVTHHQQLVLMA